MLTEPAEFCQVELVRSDVDPLRYRVDGKWVTLQPGRRTTVPWQHMNVLVGDPFYTGVDRTLVAKTICRRWGVLSLENLPYEIHVFDDDGERITTIAEDPSGARAPSMSRGGELDPAALKAAMTAMSRRLTEMESQLSEAESAAAQRAVPVDDAPEPVKSATRRKREVVSEPIPDIPDDAPTKTPVS